jgi:hypothetical protein
VKLSKSTAPSRPLPPSLRSIPPLSTPSSPGLTVQEMAAHIIARRQPYLHISPNPLSGNSLY